ncbi:MAG: hypothetical protein RL660_638 [Bacteroidota bacterium]|jgi:cold shock protein
MADTFNKKTQQQKKAKKKQDKLERREERKTNNNKGKSLQDMIAYVDEYGNITDVPPDQQKRTVINAEDIQLGAAPIIVQTEFFGVLTSYLTEKSFGFITEDNSNKSVFIHANNLPAGAKANDRLAYEKEKTPKGHVAINVRKID